MDDDCEIQLVPICSMFCHSSYPHMIGCLISKPPLHKVRRRLLVLVAMRDSLASTTDLHETCLTHQACYPFSRAPDPHGKFCMGSQGPVDLSAISGELV